MYGTTGLQNRISQFEYPSLITTDTGVGVTGGIIMIKAGRIVPSEIAGQTNKIVNKTSMLTTQRISSSLRLWLLLSLFICSTITIVLCSIVIKPNKFVWYLLLGIILILFIVIIVI